MQEIRPPPTTTTTTTFPPASCSKQQLYHHNNHHSHNPHDKSQLQHFYYYPQHQRQSSAQKQHRRSPDYVRPEDRESYNDAYYYHHRQSPSQQLATGNRGHDSVISHPFSPNGSYPPSPSSSLSSVGRHKRNAAAGGLESGNRDADLEIEYPSYPKPQQPPVNIPYPAQAHIDPEKAIVTPQRSPRNTHISSSNPDVTAVIYESAEYNEKPPEAKAVQLLLFLSGPCAFLSLVIALWTIFSLFVSLLLQPLRLCTTRPSLSSQLTSFLAPPLNFQLHLIYSHNSATDYSPPLLVLIHLLSPLVAVGVAVAAWTAAFFWFFSAILGDPAGQDGHNDGRDSIMGVRNWWDRWLCRALR